jgi:hypothetical protein
MKKKKNSDEVPHTENPDETSVSILLLDEDEVVQPCFPPAHKYEEVINPNDADDFVEDFSDMVDQRIDDFIHIRRRRWDVGFNFDKEPIYDIEGAPQEKRVELTPLEEWSSCAYDLDAWQPDDDMVIDLFHPVEDDLSPYTHDDFRSSLVSCDSCPFEDSNLFYEYFQPPLCSDFDGYKGVVIPEQSKTHVAEKQYFRPKALCKDMQMKGKQFFSSRRISFSEYEAIPCLCSSLGSHTIFF